MDNETFYPADIQKAQQPPPPPPLWMTNGKYWKREYFG